jgi:nucleoside-diphosphate-sugar epimerase
LAHILIAGLGDLGTPLAQQWLAQGHQVSAIRRRSEGPQGVDLYSQDLVSDHILLPPDQVDLLYIIMTPASRDEAGYQAAYLTAPLRLLDALAQQQPLPPVVFVSSTAVYGEQSKQPDEYSEPKPDGFNGRVLLAAEQEVSLRTLATVVRFSGIYGPGRERLLRQVEAIRQDQSAPQPRWSNRIHSKDCVGLLHAVGQGWLSGDMQWPVIIGTDAEPVLNLAVLDWISKQNGAALPALTTTAADADKAPGKRIRSRFIEAGHYQLAYPNYRSGYEEMLSEQS